MNKTERLWKKNREKAAKLKNPTPKELPSHAWRCQIRIGKDRYSFTADTPEEAHAQALAAKSGIVSVPQSTRGNTLTVKEAMARYIAESEGILSPSTIRGYDSIMRTRFQDIAEEKINTLSEQSIRNSVHKELKRGSVKTAKNCYGFLHTVLKHYGVATPEIRFPQPTKPNKKYLQPADVGKLIKAVEGDSCEIPILLAVWLGMRRSEIMGLCWDCIDFENSTITIRRTVVQNKDGDFIIKPCAKNLSSQRTIDCPECIINKLQSVYTPGANGRVFSQTPDVIRKHLHKICQEHGITDTNVHGLRHTNAAVMVTLGIKDSIAMQRGGWTNLKTYQHTYAYIFDKEEEKANDKINSFFENVTR